MTAAETVIRFLKEHGIGYSCHSHKPIYTLEDGAAIAAATGVMPCKCLLLVNRRNQLHLLMVQGDETVNLRSVANAINSSRLSFASSETLETLLHTTPGAVSPLGLIFDTGRLISLIIDERLLHTDRIMLAPCANDQSVIISTDDFLHIFLPASGHPAYLTTRCLT